MVAAMHPARAHTDESISTCRFAQRVALIKNDVSKNEEVRLVTMIVPFAVEVVVEFLRIENNNTPKSPTCRFAQRVALIKKEVSKNEEEYKKPTPDPVA